MSIWFGQGVRPPTDQKKVPLPKGRTDERAFPWFGK